MCGMGHEACRGQTVADAHGVWSVTSTPLSPGQYTLTVQASGADGNSATTSVAVTVTG